MQAHISMEEKVHGHLNLCTARNLDEMDCTDEDYIYWVKAELNEWLLTLKKAKSGL